MKKQTPGSKLLDDSDQVYHFQFSYIFSIFIYRVGCHCVSGGESFKDVLFEATRY